MDFFKDKIVFPEMLKLLLLSFAWLGNSGMCVLVGGGRAVNRKHHPAERCDLRFGSNHTSPQGDVCTKTDGEFSYLKPLLELFALSSAKNFPPFSLGPMPHYHNTTGW